MFFKVENVTKAYGGLEANSKVNIEIEKNQIVGLIGPNGAGKSTLFQMVQGFLKPTAGDIYFKGKNITNTQTSRVGKMGIASTFQHAQLFPDLDVLESVMIGVYRHTNSTIAAKKTATDLITYIGLGEEVYTKIRDLNMFDRKRVELTASLGTMPELLLLDELFAGLNSSEVQEMVKIVKMVHDDYGITLFIVEHVMKVINSICEKVYVLNYGKIIAECKPDEMAKNEEVVKAYLGE